MASSGGACTTLLLLPAVPAPLAGDQVRIPRQTETELGLVPPLPAMAALAPTHRLGMAVLATLLTLEVPGATTRGVFSRTTTATSLIAILRCHHGRFPPACLADALHRTHQ